MNERSMRWPQDVLIERLSQPLDPRADVRLVVEQATHLDHGDTATLRLIVAAGPDPVDTPDRRQRWQVDLPVDPVEMRRLTDLKNFVLVTRSGLEEWWVMRHSEPSTAAYGTRLS